MSVFIVTILLLWGFVYGKGMLVSTIGGNQNEPVISLGQDLTSSQRDEVMNYFRNNGDTTNARLITVSNQEERKYLEGKIDSKLIGSRAISSAYVKLMQNGQGIDVKINNISWVTKFMYANALSTAGVKDAQVVVTAPFEVSGTAALTGIIKAFELASGTKLSETAKETAHQEMAESSKLGQKIGKDNAEKIIYEVKRQVIEKNLSDPEEIRRIIIEVSANLKVSLSESDIDRIVELMQNLNRLNLNISKLNQQLNRVQQGLEDIKTSSGKARGVIQRIIDFINNLLRSLGIA